MTVLGTIAKSVPLRADNNFDALKFDHEAYDGMVYASLKKNCYFFVHNALRV